MRLSNLNRFVFLLSLILLFFSPISSEEEEVDIWNKKGRPRSTKCKSRWNVI